MNIVVTGGLGFIGHNVSAKLQELGHNVIIIDNKTNYGVYKEDYQLLFEERLTKINKQIYTFDICNYYALEKLFNTIDINLVIHLASFPRQKIVSKRPDWAVKTMSQGVINLLEICKKFSVQKFVYISSSMVYGNFIDDITEDYICNPQNQYGILKLTGELLVKDYSKNNNFNYTIIRPSAVYGPTDTKDRVISKFFTQAYNNQIIKVYGIHEKLDFTYVDDVANGIVKASLSDNTKNKTYNLTRGQSHTLYHAAELIIDLIGKGNIEVHDRDKIYPSRGALNINKAKNDFYYDPKVNLKEGLLLYYEWIRNSIFWS